MHFLSHCCIFSCLLVIIAMMATPSFATPAFTSPKQHTSALTEWNVTIMNDLGSSHTMLVHCKSKDDDLGDHKLNVGQSFSWKFRVNLLANTLFWCNLSTSSNKHVSMEVFWPENKNDWLGAKCNYQLCVWVAQEDGIYLEDLPHKVNLFVRGWNK